MMSEVWGGGSFENEAAMRWVETLEDAPDLEPLEAVLDEVLEAGEGGDGLDERMASEAVAAAETVAALADRPASFLPEEVRQWCFDNPGLDLSEIQPKAIQALGVILQDAALRERLDAKGLLEEWETEVEALRDRLQDA